MKIIVVSFVGATLMLSALFFPNVNPDTVPVVTEDIQQIESFNTTNYIKITQDKMKLSNEVIQYKIIFHESDTMNLSLHMLLEQKDLTDKAFLVMLTDGTRSLIQGDSGMFLIAYAPLGMIDITTPRRRFMLGKPLIYLFPNKLKFGLQKEISEDFIVEKNDAWYLTIAVFSHSEGDIEMQLKSQKESMEITQTERHSNLGLCSAYNNGFDGKYLGVRIFVFGFSFARNLNKKIETTKGSFIHFESGGHGKGDIAVKRPDGVSFSDDSRRLATYTYYGNLTGQWELSANGRSFLWKHEVILFYIDIDPHID